jgi:ParB family transcriptional regulator, chromosome partitioning protein
MVKKAEITQSRLLFVVEAFRSLREDDHFLALLRAEGLDSMPAWLESRLSERPT